MCLMNGPATEAEILHGAGRGGGGPCRAGRGLDGRSTGTRVARALAERPAAPSRPLAADDRAAKAGKTRRNTALKRRMGAVGWRALRNVRPSIRALTLHRMLLSVLATLLVAGCSADADLAEPVVPIGPFRLGYAVVVADDARMIPPSRGATAEEWESALKQALTDRFGRFSGSRLYHLAVKVDAFALAVPGLPVVLSPKSILRLQVSVWDDAAGGKLNAEPRILTVFERFSGETVIGSGLTRSRDEQMKQLSANAARLIEAWLRDNPQWFEPRAAIGEPAAIEIAPLAPVAGPRVAPRPRPAPGAANVIAAGE